MMPIVMPMFTNDWNANHIATPDATSRPNRSSARVAMRSARMITTPIRNTITIGADEAELLAGHGEDEVGLLRRDEVARHQLAVEQALAEHAAGADRDLGLGRVVAGPGQVGGRVQERGKPGELVILEQVQAAGGGDADRDHGGEHRENAQPQAGQHDHGPGHHDEDQGHAQGRLDRHQGDQRGGTGQRDAQGAHPGCAGGPGAKAPVN